MVFTNIKSYLPEIRSSQFFAGAETAIKNTLFTGSETLMQINYSDAVGFVYPDYLQVGSRSSVGKQISELNIDDYSLKFYQKAFTALDNEQKGSLLEKIVQDQRDLLKHPDPEAKCFSSIIGSFAGQSKEHELLENQGWHPQILTFHTHYGKNSVDNLCFSLPVPSSRDIMNLSNLKNSNSENYNPASVIVQVHPGYGESYPAVLFQQKKFSEKSFEALSRGFEPEYEFELIFAKDNAKTLEEKRCVGRMLDLYQEANLCYDIIRGDFVIGSGFRFPGRTRQEQDIMYQDILKPDYPEKFRG